MKNVSMGRLGGFTLIELLVVVLIIGILSAIALPQYTVAVEKARAAEALQNIRTIEEQMKLYLMENGDLLPDYVYFQDFSPVKLGGVSSREGSNDLISKYFNYYNPYITPQGTLYIEVGRLGDGAYYKFFVSGKPGNLSHQCYNGGGDPTGIKICKGLESQGWEYVDGDF